MEGFLNLIFIIILFAIFNYIFYLVLKHHYLKHKWKTYNNSVRTDLLVKNNFGIVSTSFSLISSRQIETLRRFISRRISKRLKKKLNKRYRITCALFKKSKGSRMGKGIGKFNKWYGMLKPGTLVFEFSYYKELSKDDIIKFSSIMTKLSFKFKLNIKNLNFKFSSKYN